MADDESKDGGLPNAPVFGAIGLVAGLIIGYLFGSSGTGTVGTPDIPRITSESTVTEIQLVNHIQAELPEQDVFVEMSPGSSQVLRVDVDEADTYSENILYTTADPTGHDAFKVGENPLGPFQKGESLGFTLSDWLAGTGSGTYTVEGSTANMVLSFEKLVPNGVYTIWCSRLKFPPEPSVVDMPCGAMDGSDNAFTADESGVAEVSVSMSPLQPSTESTANAVALAYHSDGETYGTEPGPFGSNAHVQLLFLMPPPGQ